MQAWDGQKTRRGVGVGGKAGALGIIDLPLLSRGFPANFGLS